MKRTFELRNRKVEVILPDDLDALIALVGKTPVFENYIGYVCYRKVGSLVDKAIADGDPIPAEIDLSGSAMPKFGKHSTKAKWGVKTVYITLAMQVLEVKGPFKKLSLPQRLRVLAEAKTLAATFSKKAVAESIPEVGKTDEESE